MCHRIIIKLKSHLTLSVSLLPSSLLLVCSSVSPSIIPPSIPLSFSYSHSRCPPSSLPQSSSPYHLSLLPSPRILLPFLHFPPFLLTSFHFCLFIYPSILSFLSIFFLPDILRSSGHQSLQHRDRGGLHPRYYRVWTTTARPVQVSTTHTHTYTWKTVLVLPNKCLKHFVTHFFPVTAVLHRFVGRINVYMDNEPMAR